MLPVFSVPDNHLRQGIHSHFSEVKISIMQSEVRGKRPERFY